MRKQQEIYETFYEYITHIVDCTLEELKSGDTVFVKNSNAKDRYAKILSVGDTDIISLSDDMYDIGRKLLSGKNRDELYESTLIFGQTLHYVPDLKQVRELPYIDEYSFDLLVDDEINKLSNIEGFLRYVVGICHCGPIPLEFVI